MRLITPLANCELVRQVLAHDWTSLMTNFYCELTKHPKPAVCLAKSAHGICVHKVIFLLACNLQKAYKMHKDSKQCQEFTLRSVHLFDVHQGSDRSVHTYLIKLH